MANKNMVKTAVLESWYGIDKVLFGDKKLSEVISEKEKISEYLTTKAALLSNLFELYIQLEYTPNRKYNDVSEMEEYSVHKAFISKKNAKDILESEDISNSVRKEIATISKIEGLSESEIVDHVVSKNYRAISIDCLTLSEALEKGCTKCLSNFDSKARIDAHKVLRDKLIALI